jgi:hypothetical protein
MQANFELRGGLGIYEAGHKVQAQIYIGVAEYWHQRQLPAWTIQNERRELERGSLLTEAQNEARHRAEGLLLPEDTPPTWRGWLPNSI